MKAIVTVVGKDQVGIIAGVCNTLAACEINVLDISQTFDRLRTALKEYGEGRGLSVRIQREDIFDAMHKL